MDNTDSSSRSSSNRRKHSATTPSETSSVSMRNPTRSFQPVPTIEKQLTDLENGFKGIRWNVEKSVDRQPLIDVTSKFNDGLTKILADSIKVFTNSFRRGNPTNEELDVILDDINDDMNSIHNIFIAFRKIQKKVFLEYIGKQEKLPILVDFCGFVEDNSVIFLTELWNFCSSVKERVPEAYMDEITIFGQFVTDHYTHLNELQVRFIRGVNDVDLAKEFHNEEEDEEDVIETSRNERDLRKQIADSIRGGFKLVFPLIMKCWHNEFKWQLEEVLSKKGYANPKNEDNNDNDDNNEENEIQLDLFIYDLFDSRLSNIEALYSMALQLDGDDQAPYDLINFIRSEASKSYSDQLGAIVDLWTYSASSAPLQYCSAEMAHFGYVLTYYVRSEIKFNPTPESLKRLGELFRKAEELSDLQTAQELLKLLVEELNKKITQLEELYKNETQLLNSLPKKGLSVDLRSTHSDLSSQINNLAIQISEAIRLAESATFIHRKNDPGIDASEEEDEEDKEDEEAYPMKKDIIALTRINPEFNEIIHNHISELQKQLNAAYESILTNTVYGDSLSVKSGRSRRDDADSTKSAKTAAKNKKSQKMINDALSMCASVSKAVTLMSTTKQITEQKEEFRTQIELIEESICITYEHLFASTRSLIVKAIRDNDQKAAESCNIRLNEQFIIYLRHLEVLKKWYIEEMKVDLVQSVELRMEKHQGLSMTLVDMCLRESFQDIVEQTVQNYLRNIEDIKDSHQLELEILDSEMVRRMDVMGSEVHIKELEIIEHQYRIDMKRERERDSAAVSESEARVRTLLSAKQYEAARREQERLEKLRKSEWETKKKEVKKKFDEIRRKKLDQQARDLNVLEDSFAAKKKKEDLEHQKQLEEQDNMLMSSIARAQLTHIQFAKVLSTNNATSVANAAGKSKDSPSKRPLIGTESPKKNPLAKVYQNIANKILKEYNIEGVSFVKQKLPDFAVKTHL